MIGFICIVCLINLFLLASIYFDDPKGTYKEEYLVIKNKIESLSLMIRDLSEDVAFIRRNLFIGNVTACNAGKDDGITLCVSELKE